ncbi:MAG: hypothetical protein KDA77_20035 [Planctomycetaceae bacterium]|nr:hypothetical protein [Planctomycetaceae bacterium]
MLTDILDVFYLVPLKTRPTHRKRIADIWLIRHTFIWRVAGHLQAQIDKVDRMIAELVETIDEWRMKRDILLSTPGIGNQVVHTLLADLPELGTLTNSKRPFSAVISI